MNKNQWFVLGIGLIILGSFLFMMATPSCIPFASSEELLTACYVRRYSYGIPAIISFFLGCLFNILGWISPKK